MYCVRNIENKRKMTRPPQRLCFIPVFTSRFWLVAALASSTTWSSNIATAFQGQCSQFARKSGQRYKQHYTPSSSTVFLRQQKQLQLQLSPLYSVGNRSRGTPLPITLPEKEELRVCWNVTSESANPNYDGRVDRILQCLNSPAPQSYYVLDRAIQLAVHQHGENNDMAYEMLQKVSSFVIKRDHQLVLYSTSKPDGLDDENFWEILPVSLGKPSKDYQQLIVPNQTDTTVLRMANDILDQVREASEDQREIARGEIDKAVAKISRQLFWTLGIDIRGRTSADTAFLLALAGVSDERIFETLTYISTCELRRVGKRPSFHSKYILQMVEKLAAAGVKGKHVQELHRVAAECLQYKHEYLDIAENLYGGNGIDLLSSRPLLWLWRFSARQTKPKGPVSETPNDESTMILSSINSQIRQRFPPFQDPERPLIVDVGCGMGVSLLGLASTSQKQQRALQSPLKDIDFCDCNFLGADLSQLAIGYGLGISKRRGLGDKLQYMWASAEDLLERVDKEYKGPVALIMIQFPTPYRLKDGGNDDGNSQLPSDQESGFMVSRKLLGKVKGLLSKSGGRLLLQSNCEDVAVTMRSTAEQYGMQIVEISDEVENILDQHQTLRNLEWAKHGGERAIGRGWAANQLLPPMGKTETEVSCELQGTPIHRCLLSASL